MGKIVAIIPARGGSKGIHKKNIVDFCGKPLIAMSIEQAIGSCADDVYVSSDSEEILEVSQAYGAIPIKRPDDLATDFSTSESALLHAVEQIDDVDLIIFLQATSPLRESKDIDNGIDVLLNGDYDSVFSAVKMGDLFFWEIENGNVTSYNYDFKNRKRKQDLNSQIIENGSIYIFRPYVLADYNNRLGGNIGFFYMDEWKKYEIDTYEDLEICKLIYHRRLMK